MSPLESRRARQLAQLQSLCRTGAVSRAIDLAFEHVAEFGQDDEVVVLLDSIVASTHIDAGVRTRIVELRAARR